MSLMSWNTEYTKARSESKEYGEEGHANIVKKIKFCLEGINNIEGFMQTELREMYDLILQLIGSMSPWVLPERTLGTVRYTETYPGNYLICRTVPSLLQTVPSFETRISDHRDICKRIARISVYI